MVVVTWLVSHYDLIFTAIGFFLAGAAVVAKLTQTPKDDTIVAEAQSWLQKIRQVLGK